MQTEINEPTKLDEIIACIKYTFRQQNPTCEDIVTMARYAYNAGEIHGAFEVSNQNSLPHGKALISK